MVEILASNYPLSERSLAILYVERPISTGKPRDQITLDEPTNLETQFIEAMIDSWDSALDETRDDIQDLREEVRQGTKEIIRLRKKLVELEKSTVKEPKANKKRESTKVDKIYERFKATFKPKDIRKIVAIDIESEAIVGMGDSVLEAHKKAKEKTGLNRFGFRRVGYSFLHRF